jgi:serine/threonine-protein kinase
VSPAKPGHAAGATRGNRARKRGLLLAGAGGCVAAALVALLTWFLIPAGAGRGGRTGSNPAVAPPVAASRPGASAADQRPGGPAAGQNGAGVGTAAPAGSAPPGGVKPATGPGANPGPAGGDSAAPSTSPSSPSSTSPSAAAGAKTLSSSAGSVRARCAGNKAELISWQPKDPYTVQRVNQGPTLAATIVFKAAASRIRMTVTCVGGTPTAVVVPL